MIANIGKIVNLCSIDEFNGDLGTPLRFEYIEIENRYHLIARSDNDTELWYNGNMKYTFVDNGDVYTFIPNIKKFSMFGSCGLVWSDFDDQLVQSYIETGSWLTAFETLVL